MATPVEVPKLGNTVEECLVSEMGKQKGDRVSAGDVVAEIETDKATFEVTAPVDGTVLETFFDEGALVPVFTNLFVIGEPGESVDAFRPRSRASRAEAASDAPPPQHPRRRAVVKRPQSVPPRRGSSQSAGPAVRRGARLPSGGGRRIGSWRPGSGRGPARLYHCSPRVSSAKKQIAGGHGGGGEGSGTAGMILSERPGSAGGPHLRHPREDRAAHAGVARQHRAVHA